MKKRFLSIAICLTLCLSAMFVFSACKKEKEPTEAEIANQQMTSAFTNMLSQEAFKMEGLVEGQEMVMIYSEDALYYEMSMMGMAIQMWSIDGFDYTVMNDGESSMYTKSASEGDMFGDMTSVNKGATFVSSSTENGVLTLVFKDIEDDENPYVVYTIENNLITSVEMQDAQRETTSTITITYENVVVPALPTEDGEGNPIEWIDSSLGE